MPQINTATAQVLAIYTSNFAPIVFVILKICVNIYTEGGANQPISMGVCGSKEPRLTPNRLFIKMVDATTNL
jgi:hypothetical protein